MVLNHKNVHIFEHFDSCHVMCVFKTKISMYSWKAMQYLEVLLMLFSVQINTICSLNVDVLNDGCILQRYLQNSGFHRDLISRVRFPELKSKGFQEVTCKLLLIEDIPSGLYVDLDQVASLHDFGGPVVYSPEDIDIEAPEHISPSHEIYVYGDLHLSKHSYLEASISLPVHFRYHKPRQDIGYTWVKLGPPKILAHCEGSSRAFRSIQGEEVYSPCSTTNITDLCEWRELQCLMEQEDGIVKAKVPVGKLQHITTVVVGTVMVTISATLLLVIVILRTESNPIKEQVSTTLTSETQQVQAKPQATIKRDVGKVAVVD